MKKKPEKRPTQELPHGFVYIIYFSSKGKRPRMKIGSTRNPTLRMADYFYGSDPKVTPYLARMAECLDFQQCEVDIKRILGGEEWADTNKELEREVNSIIDKYSISELDPHTVGILAEVSSIRKFFERNGKN